MRTLSEIRQVIREAAKGNDDVCIRFCEIELDVWMDAADVARAGGPYSWVEDNCELEPDELELVTNHDYEVVDHEGGIVGQFYTSCGHWGSMDWAGLEEALDVIEGSHLDEAVFLAGLACDIPMDKIEEAYHGEYKDDEDFAYQLWEDCGYLSELPDYCRNYIDWEAVARDLMINDYNSENGHYFSRNW